MYSTALYLRKHTNRPYVHEVFVEENIKKGNTLQTAASKPHGGIALYRDSNRLYPHEVTAIREPQEDVISTQVHGSVNTASPYPHEAIAKLVKKILTAKDSS